MNRKQQTFGPVILLIFLISVLVACQTAPKDSGTYQATAAPSEHITATFAAGGITCSICPGTLGRVLERQLGIHNFDFNMNTGVGIFLLKAEEPFDLLAVKEVMKQSGFELLWLELEVQGALFGASDQEGNVHPALAVASTGQRFLLFPGESEEERAWYDRLSGWVDVAKADVVVRGRAHSHIEGPLVLTVREYDFVIDLEEMRRRLTSVSPNP